MSEQNIRWSQKSLDELAAVYREEIAPKRRREGYDPDRDRPSATWLQEHGYYSGLEYALRTHHDMTVKEFLVDVVGFEDDSAAGGYEWPTDHEETIDAAETFVRSLERRDVAESTRTSYRSKVATYLRTYEEVHGQPAFGDRLRDREDQPRETERVIGTFDALREDLGTNQSVISYVTAVQEFYDLLRRRGYAVYDPSSDLRKELGIDADDFETGNRPALSAQQVRALANAAETSEEDLLVLASCAWGLRRSEVASLHASQLELDSSDPHIYFETRKNGPGTVALIYGIDVLEERLLELGERDRWNGYLFPSRASESGHRHEDTITDRFKRLSERAGVTLNGEPAKPHAGRRFWYREYTDVVKEIATRVQAVAEEQGSSDEQVVYEQYLNEADRREQRRELMRERLAEAFE